MDYYHIHISMVFTSIVTISLLLLTTLPSSLSQQPPFDYSVCSQKPYECGGLHDIYYPFWGQDRPHYCGGGDQFNLTCDANYYTFMQMGSQRFEVLEMNTTAYTVKMLRVPLQVEEVCSRDFHFSLSPPFMYNQTVHNITIFYDCSSGSSSGRHSIRCTNGNNVVYYEGGENEVVDHNRGLQSCQHRIQVPAEAVSFPNGGDGDAADLDFGEGFDVNYTLSQECVRCLRSKGGCGSNDTHPFTCYYPIKNGHQTWKKIVGGVGAVVGALAIGMVAFYFYHHRKKTHHAISYIQPRSMSSDPSLKDTEIGSINYRVHLFSYSELEAATNYFDSSRELGDGGFGTVYFGKLRDGRCVAVKRLYENNYKRVEQFKNEIEILADLHHRNLVSLYGCTSRHSRELLLVYEYIPNGTVADHLHGDRAKAGTLPWHIRMNIAVETASALAYLHASEIIHRDVKTNNILLDSHFVVKVADFGLSRLFPNNVTHVSTVPQGTPGYVDPEYHECYQLTSKSDVYSFGVVLAELISSLPAVDITRHRHEINLSNMAINKIHNQALHELVDPHLGFESDYKVRKMINAVAELAFQCLQSSKDMRPTMQEVLDTLKDIQSDGKYKSQPEVMDISTTDDVVLLKDDPPPPSPDSNAVSKSTTPNASG